MSIVPDTAIPLDETEFEEIYARHFDFLVSVAVRKFRVPEGDAETLAHEVFLTYLRKAGTIRDLHSWLVGAICHASRYYWRLQKRSLALVDDDASLERIDPASTRILDSLPAQLAAREALACLSPRNQEILRLRYIEGCSIAELAAILGVRPKYAQKLVTKCLRRAEQEYEAKGKVTR
jgi:RNA polymerase sigma-70 factor (ECF subfamily)